MDSCCLTFCKKKKGRPRGITATRSGCKDITPYSVPFKDSCDISLLPFKGKQPLPVLKRKLQQKFKGQFRNILGQLCMILDYARSVHIRVSPDGVAHSFFISCTNKTLAAWFGMELQSVWAAQLINRRLWDLMELGVLVAADNGVWYSPFEGEPQARSYFMDDAYARSFFSLAKKENVLPECRWVLTPVTAEQGRKAVLKAEKKAKASKTFKEFLARLRKNCVSGKNVMVYHRTYGKGMGLSTKEFWHLVNGLYREASPWYNDLEKDIATLNSFDENKGEWAYNGDMNVKVTNSNFVSGMSFRVNTRLCGMKAHNGSRGRKKGSDRDKELVKDLGRDYITYDFHASILSLTRAMNRGIWAKPNADIYDELYMQMNGQRIPNGYARKQFKKEILSSYMPLSLDQAVNYAYRREVDAVTESLAEMTYGDKMFAPHSIKGKGKLIQKAKSLFCDDGSRLDLCYTTAKNLENLMGRGKATFMGKSRERLSAIHNAIVETVGAPFGSVIFEFESCLVTRLCLELRKALGCKVRNVFDAVYIPKTDKCGSEMDLKQLVEDDLMPKIFAEFHKKWMPAIQRRIDLATDRLEKWISSNKYRMAI